MQFATLILVCVTPLTAQEKLTEHTLKVTTDAKPAKAELSQFKFLQGAWSGTGLGAKCDEMWTAPAGDCMLGTFRMVKEKKLVFTEFCMLQKDADGGVVLRLKHFNPNFDGWEKKDKFVSFPLVKVEKNTAYFGGLTYAQQADGSLKVWVAMKKKDGTFNEGAFHFKRVAGVPVR
ncbi:MAG: DUF6265 family protein [Planctomycetaceae bacterium]